MLAGAMLLGVGIEASIGLGAIGLGCVLGIGLSKKAEEPPAE